jgi:hypothetical protein
MRKGGQEGLRNVVSEILVLSLPEPSAAADAALICYFLCFRATQILIDPSSKTWYIADALVVVYRAAH